MSHMADTVVQKNREAELAEQKRFLQYANERDMKAERADREKREAARQRDINITKTLAVQMAEKRRLKEKEMEDNKKYVQMVLDRDDKDRRAV